MFKATVGLLDKFGPERVRDTPISEQAIVGAAMGAAMTGLRPVAELMFADFVSVCHDVIANQIAKARYMTNGQVTLPLRGPFRQRRRAPLRRSAFPERGELVDGGARAEGRGAIDARGCRRFDGRGGPRRRPGDVPGGEGAVPDQWGGPLGRACGRTGHSPGPP